MFQYIFADVNNRCLFTTTDMAETLTKYDLDFTPSFLDIHPKMNSVVAAHDKDTNMVRSCSTRI